jgi:hypothetical protein
VCDQLIEKSAAALELGNSDELVGLVRLVDRARADVRGGCGRRAANIEELREWMGMHYTDQLQIRMNRRLHGIDAGSPR